VQFSFFTDLLSQTTSGFNDLSAKHWAAESGCYGPGAVADPMESTFQAPATGSLAGLGGGVKRRALTSFAEDGMGLFDELNREMKKNAATRSSFPALHVSPGEHTRPLADPQAFTLPLQFLITLTAPALHFPRVRV
jgi:hypothetical protein